MSMTAERVYGFATTVVQALRALGAVDFVVSPGSRSTPVALSLAKLVAAEHLHVVVDERAAAFFALGLSRVTGAPTVLVCTSGSAVAHYHPAVLEADLAEVPLIVLSSDRPVELVRSGASQTIDQDKIFGSAVRAFVELGAPDEREDRTLVAAVTRAYAAATREPAGPVHLNVRFRKPLEPPERFFAEPARAVSVPSLGRSSRALDARSMELLEGMTREPVAVVLGAMPYGAPRRSRDASLRASLDRVIRCGHLVLTEPASGVAHRGAFDVSLAMRSEDFRRRPAGRVLVLGQPSIEPGVEAWLGAADERVLASPSAVSDPEGRATQVLAADPRAVLDALGTPSTRHPSEAALAALRGRLQGALERESGGAQGLTEPGVSTTLARELRSGSLMLGNSLAIRDFGRFGALSIADELSLHHQRGHAGIDGMIAGAAGIRSATAPAIPVAALLGDVTFAHDIGSLALLREVRAPLVFVVLDNGGGRIFERLPVARAAVPEAIFERLYLTPPRVDLVAVSRAFGVDAERVERQAELALALSRAIAAPKATVLVATIDVGADRSVRQALESIS